jgi:hypothetical protein
MSVEILERILPTSDQITYNALALGGTFPAPLSFHAAQELYDQGLTWTNTPGINVYYSPAGYEGGGRNEAAAVSARAVWLDVDCEKPNSKYPSLQDGLNAVWAFAQELGLFEPLLICSGQGLHVYWPFYRDVVKAEWKPLAQDLEKAVNKYGLGVDPHFRMTSLASLLRVPGTNNYGKDGVTRPVYLIHEGDVSDPAEFGARLTNYLSDPALPGEDNFDALNRPKMDWDALPILEGCAQLIKAGDALASRDSWIYMLSVMRYCDQGREIAKQISQQDVARFDEAEFHRQFDSLYSAGPTRCETFRAADPIPCQGCPWLGRATTPIDVGRYVSGLTDDGLVPFHNARFEVVPNEGLYYTGRARGDEDGGRFLINTNEFYISEVLSDTEGKKEQTWIKFVVRAPGSPKRMVEYSMMEDVGRLNLTKWLGGHRLMPTEYAYIGLMEEFMGSYIAVKQSQVNKEQRSHFGWTSYRSQDGTQREGFVLGAELYTPEGIKSIKLNERCQSMLEREFVQMGDLETWKLIPEMYKTLDQKEAQLFICGAFAAPFMKFNVGTATNLVMSLWDARGGKGKSSLLQVINSVWGHPKELSCSKNDTLSARFQILSARKNLPVCMDELTTMRDDDLSTLMFDAVNGREKRKSTRSGTGLHTTGSWDTILFVTSNRSIHELLRARSAQTISDSMRVVEIRCEFPNYADTELGAYIEDCLHLLSFNYGVAGAAFMAKCFETPEVFKTVAEEARGWDQITRETSDERFWTYGLGTILAVGRLATSWGFLPYDMEALEMWTKETLLPASRSKLKETLQSPESILGTFINDNIPSMLVVHSEHRPFNMPMNPLETLKDPYVKRYPTKDLAMRLEADTQTLYVNINFLTYWLISRRLSFEELRAPLVKQGVWDNQYIKKTLAAFVPILGNVRVKCVRLELSQLDELETLI